MNNTILKQLSIFVIGSLMLVTPCTLPLETKVPVVQKSYLSRVRTKANNVRSSIKRHIARIPKSLKGDESCSPEAVITTRLLALAAAGATYRGVPALWRGIQNIGPLIQLWTRPRHLNKTEKKENIKRGKEFREAVYNWSPIKGEPPLAHELVLKIYEYGDFVLDAENKEKEGKCCVCLDDESTTLGNIPCGNAHKAQLCFGCARGVHNVGSICPLCKGPFQFFSVREMITNYFSR